MVAAGHELKAQSLSGGAQLQTPQNVAVVFDRLPVDHLENSQQIFNTTNAPALTPAQAEQLLQERLAQGKAALFKCKESLTTGQLAVCWEVVADPLTQTYPTLTIVPKKSAR